MVRKTKEIPMELYEAIQTRRSVRKFKAEAIPEEKILRILEAANLAPTASNRQPWHFIVVRRSSLDRMFEIMDRSFRERVEEVGRATLAEKIKDLPIPVDLSNDKVKGLNEFYRTFGGAPLAVVVYVEKADDPWLWKNNLYDAAAAIENLLLAAWGEGLGSCWMTGPLQKKGPDIKAFLRIPDDKEIVGIVPLGIPAHHPKMPPKEDVRNKTAWFG
jgi:nitroreductase